MSTPRQIVAIKGRRSGAGLAARLMRIGAVLAMVLAFAGFVAPADAQTAPAAAQAQAQPAAAPATSTPLPSVNVGNIGGEPVSMPLQVLLLMTAITLLPAALLGLTAFTRIIIVLGLLRQALGTGQTPSNQVLVGLALFLTMPYGKFAHGFFRIAALLKWAIEKRQPSRLKLGGD